MKYKAVEVGIGTRLKLWAERRREEKRPVSLELSRKYKLSVILRPSAWSHFASYRLLAKVENFTTRSANMPIPHYFTYFFCVPSIGAQMQI